MFEVIFTGNKTLQIFISHFWFFGNLLIRFLIRFFFWMLQLQVARRVLSSMHCHWELFLYWLSVIYQASYHHSVSFPFSFDVNASFWDIFRILLGNIKILISKWFIRYTFQLNRFAKRNSPNKFLYLIAKFSKHGFIS